MKKLFFLLLAIILPAVAGAYDAEIDGIYYNFNNEAKRATVTYLSLIDNQSAYSGTVNIPPTVTYNGETYDVTDIGSSAFEYCSGLTSITIPSSVTSIGGSVFDGCSGLTSVHISDLEAWCKISFRDTYSNPLFFAHHLFLNGEEITNLVIPNTVTKIGFSAFDSCSGLTSVTIPGSVTSIGAFAFADCSGLTSVTIPGSVTNIGGQAFFGCSGLTSVHISDLAAWCKISFRDSYSNPLSWAQHLFLNGEEITNLVIPSSVTSIGEYAFSGCSGLTSVTIPDSVTSIGEYAFFGCSALTSVTIPNSVTSIGSGAFYDCSGLTSITIGNGVTSIEGSAFSGCPSIMTVKSYIKEPFNVNGLFSDETYRQGTLYVPQGTKDLYIRFDGWREFLKIEEMEKEPAPNGQCATPTIIVLGNRFKFQCETPGAEFTSSLTTEENFTGDEVVMDNDKITYTLTVYATAPGYDPSSPAKYRFTVSKKDVNQDGSIDVADIATIIDAMAAQAREQKDIEE